MSIENQLISICETLPPNITLVAVSKTYSSEAIEEAYNSGQRVFGESRPQEMRDKYELLPKDIEWQMIGHLQTNKIKYIVPFVSLIQSVDSARLVEAIQREAVKCGRVIDILLEVHVADEQTKTGWEFGDLLGYISGGALADMTNIRVRGVMGIATYSQEESVVRRDFERLSECKELLSQYFGAEFDTLSMGMSDDYPLAIECGATMVRVGSSIFGAREYNNVLKK